MLKFIKHHMETIDGISIYPVLSFLIFFIFFLLMLVYVIRADKTKMASSASIPLDNEPLNTTDHEK